MHTTNFEMAGLQRLPIKEEKKTIENEDYSTIEPNYINLGLFKITYYCMENYPHICNDGDSTCTATGQKPIPYKTIAVDPKIIKLGSQILIAGKLYTANDTGGAIKGNRIDIVVPTHKEALELGVKYSQIFIIKGE